MKMSVRTSARGRGKKRIRPVKTVSARMRVPTGMDPRPRRRGADASARTWASAWTHLPAHPPSRGRTSLPSPLPPSLPPSPRKYQVVSGLQLRRRDRGDCLACRRLCPYVRRPCSNALTGLLMWRSKSGILSRSVWREMILFMNTVLPGIS
jgi:hypothetical protein